MFGLVMLDNLVPFYEMYTVLCRLLVITPPCCVWCSFVCVYYFVCVKKLAAVGYQCVCVTNFVCVKCLLVCVAYFVCVVFRSFCVGCHYVCVIWDFVAWYWMY